MAQRMVAGMARSYIVAFMLVWGLTANAALPDTVDKVRPSIVAVGTVKPAQRASSPSTSLKCMALIFVVGPRS